MLCAVPVVVGSIDRRSADMRDGSRAQCEPLLPLFVGPTGSASVARLASGQASDLVLLRQIAQADIAVLEPVIAEVCLVENASVSPVLGLVEHGSDVYVASAYVHAITLFELLKLSPVPLAVAVRIMHDALWAAERFEFRRRAPKAARYLFEDTVWISSDGSVTLSEPVVAAQLTHDVPNSLTRSRRAEQRSTASAVNDSAATAEVLQRLLAAGSEQTVDESARAVLWNACISPQHRGAGRAETATRLATLPRYLFASSHAVGDLVEAAAGAILQTRQQQLQQALQAFAPVWADEEVTACVNIAMLSEQSFGGEPSPNAVAGTATGEFVLDEAELWLTDPEQDEQEVTSAFRPSDLPRLLASATVHNHSASVPDTGILQTLASDPPPELYERNTAAPGCLDTAPSLEARPLLEAELEGLLAVRADTRRLPINIPSPTPPLTAPPLPHPLSRPHPLPPLPTPLPQPLSQPHPLPPLPLSQPHPRSQSSQPAPHASSQRPSVPIPLQRVVDDPDVLRELNRAHWRRVRAVSISVALAALSIGGLLLSTYG